MPKPKKKPVYTDPLSSLTGFVYGSGPGKPGRLKPVRPSGKDNSNSIAGGFRQVMEIGPNLFANSFGGSLNQALNQNIIDLSIDKPDPGKTPGASEDRGQLRLRNNEVIKAFTNPNKYWQTVFNNAKAESEYAKYVGLGKVIDGTMVAMWASRNKLPMGTALDLGTAAGMEVSNPMAQKAEKFLVQNIAYDTFSKQDAAKIFNALDKTVQTNYTRDSLKKILAKEFSGAALDDATNKLYDQYIGTRVTGTTDEPNKTFGGGTLQKSTFKIWKEAEAKDIAARLKNAGLKSYNKDDVRKVLAQKYSGAQLDKYTEDLFDAAQGDKRFALNAGGVLGNQYTGGYTPGRYLTEGRLNAFGFREITAENLRKKANLIDLSSATTPQQRTEMLEQRKALLESAALMETISRAKFSYQPAFPNFKGTVSDLERTINNIGSRGTITPQDQAFKNSLLTLKQTIENAEAEYEKNTEKKIGFFSLTGGVDKYDGKSVKKAMSAEIEYERLKTERLISKLQAKTSLTALDQSTLDSLLEKRFFLETKERALQTLPLTDFRFNVNNYLSMYSSVKSVLLDGKNIGSIIDGSYYRDQGAFRSSRMDNMKFMKNGRVMSTKGAMFDDDNVGTALGQLTYLYYLTPGVLVSSLFNGDASAFMVYNTRRQFLKSMSDSKIRALLASPIGAQLKDFVKKDANGRLSFDGRLDNDPEKFATLLGVLKNSNNPSIARFANRTEKFVKIGSEFAYRLSWVKGMTDGLNGFMRKIDAQLGGRVRKLIADKVLKKMLDNAAWHSAVEQFVANNIGVLQMVRVYVQETIVVILEGIGISVGGPVGAALAFIASEIVTAAVFEGAKIFMQLLSVVVILMVALFAFIFFYSTNVLFHNPIASTASYRYVVPGEGLQCVNYNPDSVKYPTGGGGGGGNYPPVDSTCPFVFTPQICTQGDGSNSSGYHQLKKAMDVGTNSIPEAVWYAPTDGKITHFTSTNYSTMCPGASYGGWLEFTDSDGNVYVLLHVDAVAPIGGRITKGTAVAVAQRDIEVSNCWTGPHFHVEVKSGGTYVDSEDWYINKLKCPISACH